MTTIADYGNLSVRLPDTLYAAVQALAGRQHRLARDIHTEAVGALLAARAGRAHPLCPVVERRPPTHDLA